MASVGASKQRVGRGGCRRFPGCAQAKGARQVALSSRGYVSGREDCTAGLPTGIEAVGGVARGLGWVR